MSFFNNDLVVAILPVLGVTLMGMLFLSLRRARRRRFATFLKKHMEEEARPKCLRCGYSLEGLSLPRCPECGTLRGFTVPMSELGLDERMLQEARESKKKANAPQQRETNSPDETSGDA